MLKLTIHTQAGDVTASGTVLHGSSARLLCVNGIDIEAPLQGALLIALIVNNPWRLNRESTLIRTLSLVLLGAIAFNDIVGIARMVDLLLSKHPSVTLSGRDLIRVAVVIWLTNVIVFALAFFELDQGGPFQRLHREGRADFLFPQQPGLPQAWTMRTTISAS